MNTGLRGDPDTIAAFGRRSATTRERCVAAHLETDASAFQLGIGMRFLGRAGSPGNVGCAGRQGKVATDHDVDDRPAEERVGSRVDSTRRARGCGSAGCR